jgi:S1-C subfamily serine protease
LGATATNMTVDGAPGEAVYLERITGEGLALDPGLKTGDLITRVNGVDAGTIVALARVLADTKVGEMVEFEVVNTYDRDDSVDWSTSRVLKAVVRERRQDFLGDFLGIAMRGTEGRSGVSK